MLLENKHAVIYGAAGSIGGAVTRAFAREGATVFVTGNPIAIGSCLTYTIHLLPKYLFTFSGRNNDFKIAYTLNQYRFCYHLFHKLHFG